MDIKDVRTAGAPEPVGPYSQAVVAGGFVFCSGQIALDPVTGTMVDGDVAAETAQVMDNLKAVLDAAGSSLDRAVKMTIYLSDMDDFAVVNEVYGRYFGDIPPARSTVQAARLPKGANVEIDCIAVRTD